MSISYYLICSWLHCNSNCIKKINKLKCMNTSKEQFFVFIVHACLTVLSCSSFGLTKKFLIDLVAFWTKKTSKEVNILAWYEMSTMTPWLVICFLLETLQIACNIPIGEYVNQPPFTQFRPFMQIIFHTIWSRFLHFWLTDRGINI